MFIIYTPMQIWNCDETVKHKNETVSLTGETVNAKNETVKLHRCKYETVKSPPMQKWNGEFKNHKIYIILYFYCFIDETVKLGMWKKLLRTENQDGCWRYIFRIWGYLFHKK